MGYIMMKAPKGMPKGDPKFNAIFFIVFFSWLIIFLLLPENSEKTFWKVLHIIWLAVPIFIIGVFILYILLAIIINQIYTRNYRQYEKLPEWIRRFSEKYIL